MRCVSHVTPADWWICGLRLSAPDVPQDTCAHKSDLEGGLARIEQYADAAAARVAAERAKGDAELTECAHALRIATMSRCVAMAREPWL